MLSTSLDSLCCSSIWRQQSCWCVGRFGEERLQLYGERLPDIWHNWVSIRLAPYPLPPPPSVPFFLSCPLSNSTQLSLLSVYLSAPPSLCPSLPLALLSLHALNRYSFSLLNPSYMSPFFLSLPSLLPVPLLTSLSSSFSFSNSSLPSLPISLYLPSRYAARRWMLTYSWARSTTRSWSTWLWIRCTRGRRVRGPCSLASPLKVGRETEACVSVRWREIASSVMEPGQYSLLTICKYVM